MGLPSPPKRPSLLTSCPSRAARALEARQPLGVDLTGHEMGGEDAEQTSGGVALRMLA